MQRIPTVYFGNSPLQGRGVFTYDLIPAGALIEVCPVIVIPKEQVAVIHKTVLHDYYFTWGDEQQEAAIVLGFGGMYNHSENANAHFIMDYEQLTMDFIASKNIQAGEEIMINYNGDEEEDHNRPLWFDVVRIE